MPLGGVDEIGKNITAIEYGDDIIVIDCGTSFPKEDMLGIDMVIPDVTFLARNAGRIRGYVITHGHEDHIGGLPYIIPQVPAPVYGTRLTLALCEHKFKEHRLTHVETHVVTAGDTIKLGCFGVEFIHVNHSIAGAVALAIHTPAGIIVHTGDFKIDFTPVEGETMNLQRLAELGRKGVLCMMADSTNVERPGYTMSERTVGETFNQLFRRATGRIIVAQFASNIHRIQQVVDAAVRYNRKVCLSGRSVLNVSGWALQLGDLHIPEGRRIEIEEIDKYDDAEVVVITTGSQGEAMAGLSRMAFGEHRKLQIRQSDMVVISATPIPGNEKYVSRVINQLFRMGADVIYEAMEDVHVSGHACREELKVVHSLVKPKFFVPMHGEFRHLHHHALLAASLGTARENIIVPEMGDIIELSRNHIRLAGTVPTGSVLVDGAGVGDVGNIVLRDRKTLSQEGLLVVTVAVNAHGKVVSDPEILSRGFVYVRENEELLDEARELTRKVLSGMGEPFEWNVARTKMRDALHDFLYAKTKRNPMILPIILEVEP